MGRGERKKEPHLSLAAVTCFPGRRGNLLPRWVFDPPDHNAVVSDLAGLLAPSRFWAPSCPGSLMCPVAEKWVCSSVGAERVSWPVEGVEQRFCGLSCAGHLFRACLRGGRGIDSANLAFLRSPELSRSGHYRHAVALRVASPSVAVAAVPVPVTLVGRFKHTSPGAQPPLRGGGVPGAGGGDPPGSPQRGHLARWRCQIRNVKLSPAATGLSASAVGWGLHSRQGGRGRRLLNRGAGAGDPQGDSPGLPAPVRSVPPERVRAFLFPQAGKLVLRQARGDATETREGVLDVTAEPSVRKCVPWGGHVLPRCLSSNGRSCWV